MDRYSALQDRFHGLEIDSQLGKDTDATGDVFPLYDAPILRESDDARLVLETRSWGLLPPNFRPKAADLVGARKAQRRKLVNARSEGLSTTWPWKLVYGTQRYIIPAELL